MCATGLSIKTKKAQAHTNGVCNYAHFMKNRGKALSRDEILQDVWGMSIQATSKIVDVTSEDSF